MDLSIGDLKRLSELLKPEESSDSDDDLPKTGVARFGPGHIGATKKTNTVKPLQENDEENRENEKNGKDIWDESEIPEGIVHDETDDPRKTPEYYIKYKQAVSAEEMFLQMGQKTPATASCEDMVVDIKLLGENRKKVDLQVSKNVLELRSPLYRLSLPLPHPVDSDSTKAVWESEKLTVTLRLQREFDFVNF